VMALLTRHDQYGLSTGIDTTRIARASRMISSYTGMPVQPNKAIVGGNAFAHESGIHQDGVLKHQATYEIMRPETIGLVDSTLILGKHSGRHAFAEHISSLGYQMGSQQLEEAFRRFKELAGKKREVGDADIEALIADLVHRSDDAYRLVDLQVVAGRPGLSTATVRLVGPDEDERIQASVGTGPIDAIYRAILAIVGVPNRLEEFRIHAITEGIDAQGAVSVRISSDDVPVRIGGYGTDTDILVASAHAYINALNRLIERQTSQIFDSPSISTNNPTKQERTKGELNERPTREGAFAT
ncbi:2-isopropylmalate synthase, partial [Candidatus Bipolaricaulota bacterium]|nr:2-isopropylmalate synthase [Candidatus Bipolaricaulota bacterium]